MAKFMYRVFTRMPGGVTVGDLGLCCCVPCLRSAIFSVCLLIPECTRRIPPPPPFFFHLFFSGPVFPISQSGMQTTVSSYPESDYNHCSVLCFSNLFSNVSSLKGGRGCLMSPPCLEFHGRHLIPLYGLLSCSSAYSPRSFCLLFVFCLLALSPVCCCCCCFVLFFLKILHYFSLRDSFFFVWLLFSNQEMVVNRWYVQHAAIWYLCVYMIFFILFIVSIRSFLKKRYFLSFNLVSINQTEGLTIPACPGLTGFLLLLFFNKVTSD